jgi:serine/threonine protein phosphatase PrpC
MARAHDEVVLLGADMALDFRPRATCAICLIQEGGSFWGHIGDSRIYHMRNGRLVSRSRDHSHVEILIQEGAITEEEALGHPMRNFVECCIGGDAPVPDMSITRKKPLEKGDVLLACSDGLWSGISDEEMSEMATRQGMSVTENLKALSMVALSANAPYSDNTTGTALRWISA